MPHPLLVLALSTPLSPSTFSSKQHAYLDQDQLFQYQPLTGQFSVLQLIRGARLRGGACPAVNTLPLQSGTLPPFRTHVYLGHERLLELNPASGEFRVLCFNRTKPCAQPANTTVPAYDVVQRGVRPDFVRAQLVALGQDELLVFQPATRSFHIRMYDRSAGLPPPPLSVVDPAEPPSATGEPFPGEPVVSGTLGDAPEATSLAYLGGGLLLAHAPGFDLGAARWALHRYDRTALGDSGGAPRALRSLGSGTWTGPRDTLQYTYVGADTLLEVNPTTCRYHLRRLVRPDDAPAPAPRCTSCPSSASSAPAVGFSEPIAADVRGGLLDSGSLCAEPCSGSCLRSGRAGCGWCESADALWRGSAAGGCYCDCDTWRWGSTACGKPAQEPCAQLETCSACVERPWCSWCSTTQSCHGGGKHKASGELCLEWHELACPKLPLELVYEQPAFARALMPCHATDSDPKAHPWDLALLETGGADC